MVGEPPHPGPVGRPSSGLDPPDARVAGFTVEDVQILDGVYDLVVGAAKLLNGSF